MKFSLLVVEDDTNQRDFLERMLTDEGFRVRTVAAGADAIKMLDDLRPDLILLDLGLPDMDGETVFSSIRKIYPDIYIIMLTAKGSVSDVVKGFDLGAVDYVTKPYNFEELLARIHARLGQNNKVDSLKIEDLELNRKTFEVKRGSKKISLTPKEFALLEYLMTNRGQVLSREMILNRVWMYSFDIETRAVDVYMGYLRNKIDKGFSKKLIKTKRGYGYTIG